MFPVNFVVGAAVGAAATYVYKDDSAKQWLSETGQKLKDGTSSFMASFKKKANEETAEQKINEAADDAAEATEAAVDAVQAKAEEVQADIKS